MTSRHFLVVSLGYWMGVPSLIGLTAYLVALAVLPLLTKGNNDRQDDHSG